MSESQLGALSSAPAHHIPRILTQCENTQAGIIIIFCRLLHYPLSKIRQPRVIAEVIGGILLGPSVMGRIPGFTAALFPSAATPNLSLVANLGLVLFLFLVGLEVDVRFLASNWRSALSVGFAGMALPFGLGCAIAYGLYHEFRDDAGLEEISFGVYMLFVGVAMAITAFPVLCRILTELKLLHTPVGVIVLSAGVGNDVCGWILLALCVALVNAGTGLTALYVLLTALGYVLFVIYAVKPAFHYILRRSGSLQNGPTQSVMALTLLLALSSAFFTGVIGIHPIFGGFLIGLICPHEGGFAIKVTEKVEDLVTVLFLPLYFALSGLSTNLGLLNDGITWAYVIGVIAVAFVGKFVGGTVAARLNGRLWRESCTIGVLMSCKGLVELIVLVSRGLVFLWMATNNDKNIGLQAKILSTRVFTIFVVMALVTTFATTPITAALYPKEYQDKLEAWRRGDIDWDGTRLSQDPSDVISSDEETPTSIRKLLVYIRFDTLPSLFTFVSLLGSGSQLPPTTKVHPSKQTAVSESEDSSIDSIRKHRPLEVHGVRLLELTERESSVMAVSESAEFTTRDPITNTFRTFGQLNNVAVSAGVVVIPERSYADTLVSKASDMSSDLILIPWSETGGMSEQQLLVPGSSSASTESKFAAGAHTTFISSVLKSAPSTSNVGIFVNRGFGGPSLEKSLTRPKIERSASAWSLRSRTDGDAALSSPVTDRSHHIFLPFLGGDDDRFALRFVLQLARSANVTATIVLFESSSIAGVEGSSSSSGAGVGSENTFFSAMRDSLPPALASRVVFESVIFDSAADDKSASSLIEAVLARARKEVGTQKRNAGDLVVVGRRFGGLSESGAGEGSAAGNAGAMIPSETSRALGVLGTAVARAGSVDGVEGVKGSLLVVQSRRS